MSKIFTLNLKDLLSAFFTVALTAGLGAILATGSFFGVDWKNVIDIAMIAGVGSLLKSLGTDREGKLLGAVKIK